MIKLAVFDWNSTILADFNIGLEGANRELASINHPPITASQFRAAWEVPIRHYYANLGVSKKITDDNYLKMAQAFHAFYEPRAAKAHTRRGARLTLKTLTQKGIVCIILSNHTAEGIYPHLERLKLTEYFEAVLANEAIGMSHHKGKQERLSDYLKDKPYNTNEIIIIGDGVEEVQIARHLKAHSISITGGTTSTSRLKKAKPDMLIHKLPDIVDIVKELSK